MKQHTSSGSRHYVSPALLTPGQTFLWFMGGIIAMFVVVSLAFAIKLGAEGRLPSLGKSKADTVAPPAARKTAANAPPVAPPVASASPASAEQHVSPNLIRPDGNSTFEPGTENVLPQEVAHLARDSPAPGTPPNRAASPPITASPTPAVAPAPVVVTPAAAAPAAVVAAPAAATPAVQAPAILPRSAAGYTATPQGPAEDIGRAVNEWASAWQSKDVDSYLKHYADDFKPAGGLTRSVWLQQRRQRLGRPGEISVELSDLDIKADAGNATARFTQSYSTQGKTLRETKTLDLALRNGHWLIREERIGQ